MRLLLYFRMIFFSSQLHRPVIIRTADCRLEDMNANHTQATTSYPSMDYDTIENFSLVKELEKVNYY